MLLKLAKRLKRFTAEEISMFVELDCKNELEKLVEKDILTLDGNFYEYLEPKTSDYKIITFSQPESSELTTSAAVLIFLNNYAKQNCSEWTSKTYISIFKINILPYFKDKLLAGISAEDAEVFYKYLVNKGLSDSRIKNTMALLNQLIHYFQENGTISKTCDFKVKRINKVLVHKRGLTVLEAKNILKVAKAKDKILYQILSDISKSGEAFANVITRRNKNGKFLYLKEHRSIKMQEKRLREKFRTIKLELGLEKIKFDTLRGVLKGES